jgi:hypothetical protein
MSTQTTQTILAAVCSLIFIVVIYRLGHKQRLSFRYTVGWLALGGLGLIAGGLLPIIAPLAKKLHLSPVALVVLGALILILTLCVQLSISISGMQEHIRRLTEEAALLREEHDDARKL